MSSWYVENLLRGSTNIKEGIKVHAEDFIYSNPNYEVYMDYGLDVSAPMDLNLDSEVYMDLLSVEKTLKDLEEKNLIKRFDKKIVDLLSAGLSIEEVSERLHIARPTVIRKFSAVCDRVAYVLGDNFTDMGYVAYLKDKYRLTDEQVERALNYMRSSTKRVVINQR